MASGGSDYRANFKNFATKNNGAEATTKDMTRWCQDAGGILGAKCNSNHLDISFSTVKPKGKTTITLGELDRLIDELAKQYKLDKKCDDATARRQIQDKLGAAKAKGHGTTGISKTGGVDRMTDVKGYTGAHKERFDDEGKGKGIDGREYKADNTGYVGNYKGEGSWDKKN